MPQESGQENLITDELLDWLAENQRPLIGEYLYPYVHRAVIRLSMHRHLAPDDSDDLIGEAFLRVMTRIQQKYDQGKLRTFNPGLVYMMVEDCYHERFRGREGRERGYFHYDAEGSDVFEYDAAYANYEQQRLERQIQTVAAVQEAISRLDADSQQMLELFQQHYHICEDGLRPDDDANDPVVIKAVRSSAIKHVAASLRINKATAYRRLNRAGEHLRQFLEDIPERED